MVQHYGRGASSRTSRNIAFSESYLLSSPVLYAVPINSATGEANLSVADCAPGFRSPKGPPAAANTFVPFLPASDLVAALRYFR